MHAGCRRAVGYLKVPELRIIFQSFDRIPGNHADGLPQGGFPTTTEKRINTYLTTRIERFRGGLLYSRKLKLIYLRRFLSLLRYLIDLGTIAIQLPDS